MICPSSSPIISSPLTIAAEATPYASQKGQELVIEELMRWGANSQKENYEGKIPSEIAQKLSNNTKLNTLN